jgi:hypothetical protein
LGKETGIGGLIVASVIMVVFLFVGGLLYFQRMESSFSDVI